MGLERGGILKEITTRDDYVRLKELAARADVLDPDLWPSAEWGAALLPDLRGAIPTGISPEEAARYTAAIDRAATLARAPAVQLQGSSPRSFVPRDGLRLPPDPPPDILDQIKSAGGKPIRRVLIGPNRGDPVIRGIRAVHELSLELGYRIEAVVVYTPEDRNAEFVRMADRAIEIPDLPDGRTGYLNAEAVFEVIKILEARGLPVSALDPGWGFLSENAEFAKAVAERGILFLGPAAKTMGMVGSKSAGKALAQEVGMPVAQGRGPVPILPSGEPDVPWALHAAQEVGYPLLLKPDNGGGGKGQFLVRGPKDLPEALRQAVANSVKNFNSPDVSLERFVDDARHVEVQVVGDGTGRPEGIHIIGFRICSAQRKSQKMFEWSGPGILPPEAEQQLYDVARDMAAKAEVFGPSTFELLAERSWKNFFMEVNVRLQVEHTVTEERYDVDLKKEILRMTMKLPPSPRFLEKIATPPKKYSIEFRLQAEDPYNNFAPSPGRIKLLRLPAGPHIRVDAGVAEGSVVSSRFDNMIAKIIATGDTPEEAMANLEQALRETVVVGVNDNIEFGLEVLCTDEFRRNFGADIDVKFLERYLETRQAVLKGMEISRKAVDLEGKEVELTAEEVDKRKVLAVRYTGEWKSKKAYRDEAVLGAAVAAYRIQRAEREEDLFTPGSRIRFTADTLPPSDGLTFQANVEGEEAEIRVRELELGKLAVTINGRTVITKVDRVNKYQYFVSPEGVRNGTYGNSYNVAVDAEGGEFTVRISGTRHTIKIGSASATEDKGAIAAGLDASVWRIGRLNPETGKYDLPLAKGVHVKAGDELLNLTVMKMEIPVRADVDGIVEEVLINVGDVVGKGMVMVKIRPLTGDGVVAASDHAENKYQFMSDYVLGPRARLGFVDPKDAPELEAVMGELKPRLDQLAPSLVRYIGEFLIGFDYTAGHIENLFTVLNRLKEMNADTVRQIVTVLKLYSERQELFSEPYRHLFEYYLRHWKDPAYEVPEDLRPVLCANLAHYGIHYGPREPIRPNKRIQEHVLSNALLRIRQSWMGGNYRRQIVARAIELAGKYRLTEAIPAIEKIYRLADNRGASLITSAVLEAAKNIDPLFYDQIVRPLVPQKHRKRYDELKKTPFSNVPKAERGKMKKTLSVPRFVSPSQVAEEPVRRMAEAREAEAAQLHSPFPDFGVYLFRRKGDTGHAAQTLVVLAKNSSPAAFDVDQGRIVGEEHIESLFIRATQLVQMYQILAVDPQTALFPKETPLSLIDNQIVIVNEREILFEQKEGRSTGAYSPGVVAAVASNVFGFATDKSIGATTVLAHHTQSGARVDDAFQFLAGSSGQLLVRQIPQEIFYRKESPADARQHQRGKLTVEERAAKFFDDGRYEIIRVNGADKPKRGTDGEILRDGAGKIIYEPNGSVIAIGRVNGREAIAHFSDFRRLGGAVGDVEGQKMAATSIIAYLKGLPVFWFNDSGGANVPEGVPSLNRSTEDFTTKVIAGGDADPETFVRVLENHPDQEFIRRVLAQFGDGRPLIEQVKHVRRAPLAVALGIGASAGMVVYGPAELAHQFMRMAQEVFGLLTGTEVVYQVTRVMQSNFKIGGAPVLVNIAGTVDQWVEDIDEGEIIELAKLALRWFDPTYHFTYDKIQRVDPAKIVGPDEDSREETGNVLTSRLLRENVDGGFIWPYKGQFRNSSALTAAWARMAGRTVAVMGPLNDDGFGTKQAVKKAYTFARAAITDGIPIIKVFGENWVDNFATDDGEVTAFRHDLADVLAKSKVPQISILMDYEALQSTAGNIGSDLLIFVKTGKATPSQIWQAKKAGAVVVESFASAMDTAAEYIRFMSYNKGEAPRVVTADPASRPTPELEQIIPQVLKKEYDMHAVIRALVDDGRFVEVGGMTEADPSNQDGSNLITGFASINGRVIGILADQPAIRAGAPDNRGATKYRRFVDLCEKRRIPILALNDAPGFKPGPEEEGGDIQGEGGRSLKSNILSTVPGVSVSLRKAYGGRFIQAFHKWLRAGLRALATNRGQVAVMGERGGIPFTYKKDYKDLQDMAAAASRQFRAGLQSALRHVENPDLRRETERVIKLLADTQETQAFMLLDAMRDFLETRRHIFAGETFEAFRDGAMTAAVEAIRRGAELEERYRREVGDPKLALESGGLDRIVELAALRTAIDAEFVEAERAAELAYGRPYWAVTRAEALLSFARNLLREAGVESRPLVVDPDLSAKDQLVIVGIEKSFTPEEILAVLFASPNIPAESNQVLRERLVLYKRATPAERVALIESWNREVLVDKVKADVLQQGGATMVGIENGVEALALSDHGAAVAYSQSIMELGARLVAMLSPVSGAPAAGSDVVDLAAVRAEAEAKARDAGGVGGDGRGAGDDGQGDDGGVSPAAPPVDVQPDETPAPRDGEKGMFEDPQARADRVMDEVWQGSVKLEDDGGPALARKLDRAEDAITMDDGRWTPARRSSESEGGTDEVANNNDYYEEEMVEAEEVDAEEVESVETSELAEANSGLFAQTGSLMGSGLGNPVWGAGAAFTGTQAANMAVLRGVLK